jgi:hypothetical protein
MEQFVTSLLIFRFTLEGDDYVFPSFEVFFIESAMRIDSSEELAQTPEVALLLEVYINSDKQKNDSEKRKEDVPNFLDRISSAYLPCRTRTHKKKH